MNHRLILILLAAILGEGTCLAQTSQPAGARGAAIALAACRGGPGGIGGGRYQLY